MTILRNCKLLEFYRNDFCKLELESQLEILGQMNINKTGDKISFLDALSHLKSLSQLTCIQVVNVVKIDIAIARH